MRFKKATGMSIYQYLLGVRVEHFAYLISTTDRTFMDIAYEVGFRDLINVSRVFRKYKGCSPMEYRSKYCVIRG
jgi:LacI family transcriptional regulator